MPDDKSPIALQQDTIEPPPKSDATRGRLDTPSEPPSTPAMPEKTPPSRARRWVRWALFLLLPLALIGGGYWYVTGGSVVSMDNAYVAADMVGVSTDISGIVKEVDVTENQHVDAGQLLYRLDDLPFRLALRRAQAQVGMVGDSINALKATHRD